MSQNARHLIASTLVAALTAATVPAFGAPAGATLTGTVYGDDVKTPLAGATVIVTDASGNKLTSQPTTAEGAFTIASVTPGRNALALQTENGFFAVATPVTLAPGETRGVHLALRAGTEPQGEEKKKKKGTGAYWTAGAIGTMTAVLVGFVAAAVINNDNSNNNPTSPSSPSN